MTAHRVTVDLPASLYERLARRANGTHRTIEEALVDAVSAVLVEPEELPSDMAEAVSSLHLLDDADLWRAARQRLDAERAAEIEALHQKRQREGLSAAEREELARLMKESTRVMLVRARSAAMLAQRGHDVSSLLQEHELGPTSPGRCATGSWETIDSLRGTVNLGGHAVDDCDGLYDG